MEILVEKLIEWISLKNPTVVDFPHDKDLLEAGLITSLTFIEFIMLLEVLGGVDIDVDENTLARVRTIDAIKQNFFLSA